MTSKKIQCSLLALVFPLLVAAADVATLPGKTTPAATRAGQPATNAAAALAVGVAAQSVAPKITGLKISNSQQANGPFEVKVLGQGMCTFNVVSDKIQPFELTKMLPVVLDLPYAMSSNTIVTYKISVTGLAGKCPGAANGEVTVWAGGNFVPPLGSTAPVISSQPTVTSLSCPPGKKC